MSLLTPGEMNSYGGTGSFDTDTLQMAIDLSEFDVEHALGTFLTPTTVSEEYPWPLLTAQIMLTHNRVTSITSVTAKHSLNSECEWTEDTECGVILNSLQGIVRLVGCNLSLGDCGCASGLVPDRAVITYIAGFTDAEGLETTATGKALRMLITLRAREWLKILYAGDSWDGAYSIKSWRSMDYSEQRELAAKTFNPLGPGPFSEEAYRLIERLRPYRAVMLRSG